MRTLLTALFHRSWRRRKIRVAKLSNLRFDQSSETRMPCPGKWDRFFRIKVLGLKMNLWCADNKVPRGNLSLSDRQDSQMTISLLNKKVRRKLWNRFRFSSSTDRREELSEVAPLRLEASEL
ncbi:hypothetical protein R1flu_009636 [Riccia fluitans]|uniref:Uncharacterized protein n=1 Tax=Riccia fluitans TaxID=41844 RepID=A0ABD1Z581_9MARC